MIRIPHVPLAVGCGITCLLIGCSGSKPIKGGTGKAPATVSATPQTSPLQFAEVASRAGLQFSLGHGGRSPLTIKETAPGGCAWIDADNDGWADALLVGPGKVCLFRNLQNGTFANVTGSSGLKQEGEWMGCAAGDYDGDGLTDLFITGYRTCALYRNLGSCKFKNTTQEAGISGIDWSLGAAFGDLNGDQKVDLFVSQYLVFTEKLKQVCQVGPVKSACGPEIYEPLSGRLFLNQGGGKFTAAPWKDTGKTWGVLVSDLFADGKPTLYLANDMMPGDMWQRKSAAWSNIGPSNGTAFDGLGHLQGGMGVDSGDYDNDGLLDLIVTTYFAQANSVYHNDGDGLFTYASGTTGIGPPTMPYVAFGVSWGDLDNDGWLDLAITNGHVRDNVKGFDESQSYAQPIQILHQSKGKFSDVAPDISSVSPLRAVGRGLSLADYNHDGKLDILVCNLEGDAILLENRTPAGNWLEVVLQDSGPNRNALGAQVRLVGAGGKQLREVRTSGSVLSAREPVVHFGLGSAVGPLTLEIRWPDGKSQTETVSKPNQRVTIKRR